MISNFIGLLIIMLTPQTMAAAQKVNVRYYRTKDFELPFSIWMRRSYLLQKQLL